MENIVQSKSDLLNEYNALVDELRAVEASIEMVELNLTDLTNAKHKITSKLDGINARLLHLHEHLNPVNGICICKESTDYDTYWLLAMSELKAKTDWERAFNPFLDTQFPIPEFDKDSFEYLYNNGSNLDVFVKILLSRRYTF